MNRPPNFIAFAAFLGGFIHAGAAGAQSKASCLKAYESAQRLRLDAKLSEARSALRSCASRQCPGLVRTDCATWLREVEAALPTIVIAARRKSGEDVQKARVFVDGHLAAGKLDGKPIVVDPGTRKITLEVSEERFEETIVANQGEKNRNVIFQLAARKPPQPASKARSEITSPSPLAYIFAGLAVAGLGSFVYFGLNGKSDLQELRDSCAPFCKKEDLNSAKRQLLIADISLGVSLLSATGAAFLFASPSSSEEPTTSTTPKQSPFFLQLSGHF